MDGRGQVKTASGCCCCVERGDFPPHSPGWRCGRASNPWRCCRPTTMACSRRQRQIRCPLPPLYFLARFQHSSTTPFDTVLCCLPCTLIPQAAPIRCGSTRPRRLSLCIHELSPRFSLLPAHTHMHTHRSVALCRTWLQLELFIAYTDARGVARHTAASRLPGSPETT